MYRARHAARLLVALLSCTAAEVLPPPALVGAPVLTFSPVALDAANGLLQLEVGVSGAAYSTHILVALQPAADAPSAAACVWQRELDTDASVAAAPASVTALLSLTESGRAACAVAAACTIAASLSADCGFAVQQQMDGSSRYEAAG